ncbi:MAG: DEAD/DEAH box helicase [Planctomycetes bacterium]|nr:DEAD/DEAH box helicase [Planctomycetota bacterium]
MVFFTGTPHRGKPFGFFALLSLLRPDLFNPHKDTSSQLRELPSIMIRNNKQNVTDLHGKPLFKEPNVQSRTYDYSPNEAHFYNMLTEFIITGKAYASSLTSNYARAVMLVLISMQKLASSSVAAIRRALKGRLSRTTETSQKIKDLKKLHVAIKQTEEAEKNYDGDFLSNLEEQIAELSAELRLMENERERLEELIRAADSVDEETKIRAIIDDVASYSSNRSVLFFTEYKATQSLLMSALIKQFGENCVTFINGDEEAREVIGLDGKVRSIRQRREEAAQIFNEGNVRFLVSTEAGGEGIDLQHSCYTLIHVDLPWNPMRLHQRVGRLNRYGQKKRVYVTSFRNPHTVEARIWDKLNEKIGHINLALRQVMSQPEDMMQLVLGMTSHSMFREIFNEGALIPPESFDSWFDKKTASFGGHDVIDTVKELVGNCSKFEFREVSNKLPRVDLPDLKPFFVSMLHLNRRRVQENEQGISFKTPEEWLVEPAILTGYQNMLFDRNEITESSTEHLLGIGHRLVDYAIDQACNLTSCITILPREVLDGTLCIFRIYDRVTSGSRIHSSVICGIQSTNAKSLEVLNDWKLLKKLNEISSIRPSRDEPTEKVEQNRDVLPIILKAERACKEHIVNSDIDFLRPECELLAVICSQT